jgi:hypothetical protein
MRRVRSLCWRRRRRQGHLRHCAGVAYNPRGNQFSSLLCMSHILLCFMPFVCLAPCTHTYSTSPHCVLQTSRQLTSLACNSNLMMCPHSSHVSLTHIVHSHVLRNRCGPQTSRQPTFRPRPTSLAPLSRSRRWGAWAAATPSCLGALRTGNPATALRMCWTPRRHLQKGKIQSLL